MIPARRVLALLLCAAFHAANAQAPSARPFADAASLLAPSSARRGDPLFAVLQGAEPGFSGRLVLLDRAGAELASGRSFPLTGRPGDYGFALGLSDSMALGDFDLRVQSGTGKETRVVVASKLQIVERVFRASSVRISPEVAATRDAPDPRREEQSKRYLAALEAFDPGALGAVELLEKPGFRWPLDSLRRTAEFGDRRRYLYETGGSSTTVHWGLDFGAPSGTPVFAPGPGKVVLSELRILTGNTIILEHLPGVFSVFMHMDSLAVASGAQVAQGANLGTVGSTGFSTGPHLHWELRVNGVACDPEALVAKP